MDGFYHIMKETLAFDICTELPIISHDEFQLDFDVVIDLNELFVTLLGQKWTFVIAL